MEALTHGGGAGDALAVDQDAGDQKLFYATVVCIMVISKERINLQKERGGY